LASAQRAITSGHWQAAPELICCHSTPARDQAGLHNLGIAGRDLFRRQRGERRGVGDHRRGLMERAA